ARCSTSSASRPTASGTPTNRSSTGWRRRSGFSSSRLLPAHGDRGAPGLLRSPVMKRIFPVIVLVDGVAAAAAPAQSAPDVTEAQVDPIFSSWNTGTPGCAVGVSRGGKPALQKAYGMADLEHGAPNRADTIFEAGSVSKQF